MNKTSDELVKLHKNLQELHKKLRAHTLKNWNRVLPFDELLFDRWEKANFLKTKNGASVYHSSYIFGNVKIGKKSWIGPFTLLDGSGGQVKIGAFCSISSGVQIYTHNTVNWSLSGGKASFEKGDVTIGDNCYLGPYSIISKNVKIGKCSVIGTHSFVNSNIPPNSIAFGIPARVVGKVRIKKNNIEYHYNEKKS